MVRDEGGRRQAGDRDDTETLRTRARHLLGKGVGLLECARRLNIALNTVKRYARMQEPTGDRRAPRYKPTLVDPYHDYLRTCRAADPAVPVEQLLRTIQELGHTSSLNQLYRYITQGRAEGDKPVTTPQRSARLLLTRPDNLRDKDTALQRELTKTCPELNELARHTGEFAQHLNPAEGNDAKLTDWISTVRNTDLPHLQSFANGLELDRAAVDTGPTLPYHNGRAAFPLLRQRILLQ